MAILKDVQCIHNKYGEVIFRCALDHAIDNGFKNINEKSTADTIAAIRAEDEENKKDGTITMMSADFQCDIVNCANEISRLEDVWTVLKYVGKNIKIG